MSRHGFSITYTIFCHHTAAFECFKYWLGFIVYSNSRCLSVKLHKNHSITAWVTGHEQSSNSRRESQCSSQHPCRSFSCSERKTLIERASYSESLCWAFWHSAGGKLGGGGSKACYSSSGCANRGCGVEEVLCFMSLFVLHPHWRTIVLLIHPSIKWRFSSVPSHFMFLQSRLEIESLINLWKPFICLFPAQSYNQWMSVH